MSVQADRKQPASARRRRLVVQGLFRALATAVVLVALCYLLPLDHIKNVPLTLAGGLLILLAVIAWQLRAIVRAKEPAVRAVVASWQISPNAPDQADTGGRSSRPAGRQAGRGDGSHDRGDG